MGASQLVQAHVRWQGECAIKPIIRVSSRICTFGLAICTLVQPLTTSAFTGSAWHSLEYPESKGFQRVSNLHKASITKEPGSNLNAHSVICTPYAYHLQYHLLNSSAECSSSNI